MRQDSPKPLNLLIRALEESGVYVEFETSIKGNFTIRIKNTKMAPGSSRTVIYKSTLNRRAGAFPTGQEWPREPSLIGG